MAAAMPTTVTDSAAAEVSIPETLNQMIRTANIFRYDERDIQPYQHRFREISTIVSRNAAFSGDSRNWDMLLEFMDLVHNMTERVYCETDKVDSIVYAIRTEYLADLAKDEYPACYVTLLNRLDKYLAELTRMIQTLETITVEIANLINTARAER